MSCFYFCFFLLIFVFKVLGHHSLKTTQIYLGAFENSQIDAAMQNLL